MSKIGVLLASYNGAKYIKEQVLSIQEQKNVNVDIFLRDDCSSDKTVEIAHDLLSDHHIIINQKRTGSAANNFFLSILEFKNPENYDYFAFADQDDIWLPEKLSKAITELEKNEASLYCSNLLIWDMGRDDKSLLKKDYKQKKYDFLFEGGSAGCTYVFNKKFFLLLREKIEKTDYLHWSDFSHDWFTYFFARVSNEKVITSSDADILYRIHDSNIHGQLNSLSFESVLKRIQMVKNGWYLNNSVNYAKCLSPDSEEFKIYKMYCENFFTRFQILLKYNFNLIRSPKKFLMFFFLGIFFTGYLDKSTFYAVFKGKK